MLVKHFSKLPGVNRYMLTQPGYLRVIIMYMSEVTLVRRPLLASPSLVVALALAALGTLALGLYPTFLFSLAEESIRAIMG